ncbi:glutamate-5-semialdehyde dehydrogenase [Anaerobacillus sp. MEB173]|uniref:glutamate-5-semialdehyde dehydrogenase n=1 Tax=Anaerobacillus sp. MEB173 TaxID=3383345 RepID=UPI003F91175C
MSELIEKAKRAKAVATDLAIFTTEQKNAALKLMATQLLEETDYILAENEKDLIAGKEQGFTDALLDRLKLTIERIQDMADGLEQLITLPDPVGEVLEGWDRPNGLAIEKVRVPLGVIGMIYEARPNVTVDASSLCLKTGNAVLLRGSSSAINSNKAIVNVIHRALEKSELPIETIQLLEDTSRETAAQMFKLNDYLDVLIPRGGAKLIQSVVENSTIPVLETGVGNCHIYIDETADKQMAIDIVVNAKTQRPSVCNAAETVVVQKDWADQHFSDLVNTLQDKNVELRGDEYAQSLSSSVQKATEEDWSAEFLDTILAVKIVADVNEAINHINTYGTKHSEAIITSNNENIDKFFKLVDAAALYHNASTRFTDGSEFGFGAEIGISTQKLHARGPMGLPALTSTKYIIRGTGQVR